MNPEQKRFIAQVEAICRHRNEQAAKYQLAAPHPDGWGATAKGQRQLDDWIKEYQENGTIAAYEHLQSKDEQQPEQPKSNRGQFFGVSIKTVDSIVAAGGMSEEVMAYLALARGVNAKYGRVSTWGAKAISDYTGMSYRTAEAALDWLIEKEIVEDVRPEKDKDPRPKRQHSKWALHDGEPDLWLANALVDGIGKGKDEPPLQRIYTGAGIGVTGFVADARLDSLMVMLHLYKHQDMVACGGVNPRAGIYRQWGAAENSAGLHKMSIGERSALYEIEAVSDVVFHNFADEALFYVPADERMARFWDAFANVERMGFCYEVTQVWSADPNKDKKAEPLYTLYVHDYHARVNGKEPYLQKDIHSAALRVGLMDGYTEFAPDGEPEFSDIKSGRFRYVAAKKAGGFPIGIYRMRFRPHTDDSTTGIQREQQRVEIWKEALEAVR